MGLVVLGVAPGLAAGLPIGDADRSQRRLCLVVSSSSALSRLAADSVMALHCIPLAALFSVSHVYRVGPTSAWCQTVAA